LIVDLSTNSRAPILTRRDWMLGTLALALPAMTRHARSADVPRFALGVASGQPRSDGMVLWTRLTGPGLPDSVPVQWELAHDEGFTQIAARGVELAQAETAHSVHAEPGGLASGRAWWYRFTALGDRSPAGRTRTAPDPGTEATLRFAIASCQRWEYGHYAAWRDITASEPDLIVFLGDYIYEYPLLANDPVRPISGGLVTTLDGYRDRYAQYRADPLLQAAHACAPWVMVWDDHEVENDYAAGVGGGLLGHSLGALLGDFGRRRAAAYQAYWEHMPFPKSARPTGDAMRIYGHLDWGRLARIQLLDNRQYRDPQVCPRPGRLVGSHTVSLKACPALLDPRRSLLGAAQERWLAQNWSLDRPWNLVAQQTLMSRLSWTDPAHDPTYWTDGWDGYAPSRQRLLSAAAQRQVPGLVVLGGDVHAHYVSELKTSYEDPRSPVVGAEFCGTSISSRGPAQSRLDAALPLNPHLLYGNARHRGSVLFRLDARTLQADLRAVDRPREAESAVRSAARFVVEAGRPGPQRA
jgi:alkaline phosphatase D